MAEQARAYLVAGLLDLQQEIIALPEIAGDLLDPASLTAVSQARATLRAVVDRPDHEFTWEIPVERPIRTGMSRGEYEGKQGGKGRGIYGTLSFKWHLRTGDAPVERVALIGNATTQMRLYAEDADSTDAFLSMWRMEVGDDRAPGCCFHTQILGTDESGPFPKAIPVPRLHTFPPTPMTCLDFLLGELFQREWAMRVQRENGGTRTWRGIQKDRFRSFLQWQQAVVENATGSPLTQLKTFPDVEVLLR